jgi:hypothetical protein
LAGPKNVHVDDNRRWSRASLRIFGETLEPEEVGVALGLAATRSHLKGELRSTRYKAVWRESAWLLQSPLADENDMVDHLKWLLDVFEPKLDLVAELSNKYKIDFFCGFSSGNGQGGFRLDSVTLHRIAKFGIALHLDLYPPPMGSDDMESE